VGNASHEGQTFAQTVCITNTTIGYRWQKRGADGSLDPIPVAQVISNIGSVRCSNVTCAINFACRFRTSLENMNFASFCTLSLACLAFARVPGGPLQISPLPSYADCSLPTVGQDTLNDAIWNDGACPGSTPVQGLLVPIVLGGFDGVVILAGLTFATWHQCCAKKEEPSDDYEPPSLVPDQADV
jgi:hypothetical protein